ncbi:hypothetical protein HRD49_03670 [Corallococcus exiguus]|uniref:hypothetical protein n=1 Tax=Corallococcus exiguus TaxID=83462 RepID=UPI001470B5C0|nr:hypothetical protein [Corallococcus exiguus]NNB89930.1 hypothetical protein [Corallococcus exiguus]NNC01916.1 hypothetical protein [Corallococcus exiguus]NRD60838.1 hypothetical protein [Corallococcus exiguus]
MKKRLTLAACLAVVLSAPAALADSGTAAGSVVGGILASIFTSPDVLAVLAVLIVGGGIKLARAIWKDRAEERLRSIGNAISTAYYTVNELALRTENKIDDKVAEALRVFREQLAAKGYVPNEKDLAQAKAQWTAMHGAELTDEKLAAQGAGALANQAINAALNMGVVGAKAALDATVVPSMPRG